MKILYDGRKKTKTKLGSRAEWEHLQREVDRSGKITFDSETYVLDEVRRILRRDHLDPANDEDIREFVQEYRKLKTKNTLARATIASGAVRARREER